jgi:SPP1 family predicted phage head-tail adaptor
MAAAGPKRQRVTIQTLSEARDSYGQNIKSWASAGPYWARVKNLSGREAVNAKQIKADTTHLVEMRYIGTLFSTPGLLPSMRLLFNSRVFNILWVNNVDERNREYQLLCQEFVVPQGT